MFLLFSVIWITISNASFGTNLKLSQIFVCLIHCIVVVVFHSDILTFKVIMCGLIVAASMLG